MRPTTYLGKPVHRKVNPDCPYTRHAPSLYNYRHGCRCPQVLQSMEDWAAARANPHCPAKVHGRSNNAWRLGCRHPDAIAAHEEWKLDVRLQRTAALAAYKRTGQCGAVVHGTLGAHRRGCRCPEPAAAYQRKHGWRVQRAREHFGRRPVHPWRDGRMAVGRNTLWFLVHGMIDQPTMGERMAAMMILSQRGSETLGYLDDHEIARRIGVDHKTIGDYRRRIVQLRKDRPLRRLADIRAKAERVRRANRPTSST